MLQSRTSQLNTSCNLEMLFGVSDIFKLKLQFKKIIIRIMAMSRKGKSRRENGEWWGMGAFSG